ncbi:hypothetical protein SAMN04489740_2527 [Arthrobacter alpinus]|uniref:Uncharacterized protein n=1 Tax=Arthrobacter alpinus TaxID=656366 RepID=A0A1H5LQD0_9MICC|nr:hypothetical protein SAMN04489740_2527 [Arthrobacter alpinus]
MVDALDCGAGAPGEGRGFYVVHDRLDALDHPERLRYYLREDVVSAIFAERRRSRIRRGILMDRDNPFRRSGSWRRG